MRSRLICSVITAICVMANATYSQEVQLFIDADYSVNTESSEAIELGVRAALKEIDYRIGDTTIEVVRKDNRGNVKRSKHTMDTYLQSPNALAVIGGIHSPPYLTHREFMNENRVLALLPWSAAGPITRSVGPENWIFRLSVDDTKSGDFFVQEAIDKAGCQNLALVLLDTGWGRANHNTMTAALEKRSMEPVSVDYFPSSIGTASARSLAQKLSENGTECLVLLANWTNGALIVNALAEQAAGIKVFSHWGITGGEFTDQVPHTHRESVNLKVLQTCALKREAESNKTIRHALSLAGLNETTLAAVKAPTGFVHGFDLTRILISAIKQAQDAGMWTDDPVKNRFAVKKALENLSGSIDGILATYTSPFEPYGADSADGHEALGIEDLCLARFRTDGLLEHAG